MTAPDPTSTAGADTLVSVLGKATQAGYDAHLHSRDGGTVRCQRCETDTDPAVVTVDHVVRLEGASDVADLLLVALLACPACGARGTLTLGYGPNAGEADAAVLAALPIDDAEPSPPVG